MRSTANSEIVEVTSAEQIPIVRELFQEYADWLGVDLCFQGFEEELRSLPSPYERPKGFIYLAYVEGQPAGCIALRPLSNETLQHCRTSTLSACEMKRLYVRPAFRNAGTGRVLVDLCLKEAKAIGYDVMRLDTLQRMQAAIALYSSFGFTECREYYNSPLEDVVYMEKQLSAG